MRTVTEVVAEMMPVYRVKARKTFLEFETVTRRHLLPYFAEISVTKVGAYWRPYCAHQRGINPERKLWHDKRVMRQIVGWAFDCDYIHKIPRLLLDPYDKSRRVPEEVTHEQFRIALNFSSSLLRDLLIVLWHTGMRFGEVRSLQANQIDFKRGIVRLSVNTKTRRERVYPIHEEALMVLKKRKLRAVGPKHYLFPNENDVNRPMSESHRSFERMKKKAGVDFLIHDLRHSFATRMIRKGVPRSFVAQLMGASERITETVYTHANWEDWFKYGD